MKWISRLRLSAHVAAGVLVGLPSLAAASCDERDANGRWYPSYPSTIDQCLKAKGVARDKSFIVSGALLNARDLNVEIAAFRGDGGSLTFQSVTFWAPGANRSGLWLSKWAGKSYDLNTLERHCAKFEPFAVAQSPCGIKMELFEGSSTSIEEYKRTGRPPPGLRSISWPTQRSTISYLPRGITFARVQLRNVDSLRLDDIVINGSVEIDGMQTDSSEGMRVELKSCIVIGDVLVSNVRNTLVLIDRCVIFGRVQLTDSVGSEIHIKDSGIEEDFILENLKNSNIPWFYPVEIKGALRLKNVELWRDDRIGYLRVGGSLLLEGIDETAPAGAKSAGIYTQDVQVKGPISIRNSVLVRTERIFGRASADIELHNVTFIEPR